MRVTNICFLLLGLAVCGPGTAQQVGPPVLQSARNLSIPVDEAALQRQFAALKAMPKAEVQYAKRGNVAYMRGDLGMVVTGTTKDEIADEVWARFKDVILANGSETLKVEADGTDELYRDIALTESIRGIPVVRGVVKLRVDKHSGRVLEFGAGFVPDRGLPKEPRLTAEQAREKVRSDLESSMVAKRGTVRFGPTATLAYLAMHEHKPAQLVWETTLAYTQELGGEAITDVVWIDAIDGTIASREPFDRHNTVWKPSPATAPPRDQYPSGIIELLPAQIEADTVASTALSTHKQRLSREQRSVGAAELEQSHG